MPLFGAGFFSNPTGRSWQGPAEHAQFGFAIYTVAGAADFWQDDDHVDLRSDHLVLIAPSRCMHRWRVTSAEDWSGHWLRWKLEPMEADSIGYPAVGPSDLALLQADRHIHQRLVPLFRRLGETIANQDATSERLRHFMGQALLAEIHLSFGEPSAPHDPTVAAALACIDVRLGDPELSLDDLVAAAGCGRTAFVQRFTAACGQPPMRHVEERRLLLARHRLFGSDCSVAEAASAVGYRDARYFGSRFRQRFGVTPSTYRG